MKTRKVICETCGQAFYTTMPRACYCSDQCRTFGRMVKRSQWEREHPRYYEELKARRQNDEAEAEG